MATKTVRALNGGNNNHPEPVFTANALATDFMSAGVVGQVALNTGSGGTGAFAVNAQGTPDMSVRIGGPSVAYVTATPTGSVSQLLRVDMSAFEDVTISANSSGSTKYDWVYIKVDPDLALNPDSLATTVATLVTSRSTSNSTDNGTPPTYGYCLAVVTIANGATSITNSNITDKRAQAGAVANSVVAGSALIGNAYNPYKFSVYQGSNQTVTANTWTKVNLDTRTFDTSSNFDITNHLFTAPVTGFYFFTGGTTLTNLATTGEVSVGINVGTFSSAPTYQGELGYSGANTVNNLVTVSAFISLTAGQTVQLYAFTGSVGIALGSALTYFQGFLVSQA